MWRSLILVLAVSGCLKQAANIANPAPEGGGTLTCREIVETCDSACTQPFCLHGCSNQGTEEASQQHETLIACGERNGCTDEDCMRTNCPGEIETCMGPEAPADDPAQPTDPDPAPEPPIEAPAPG